MLVGMSHALLIPQWPYFSTYRNKDVRASALLSDSGSTVQNSSHPTVCKTSLLALLTAALLGTAAIQSIKG